MKNNISANTLIVLLYTMPIAYLFTLIISAHYLKFIIWSGLLTYIIFYLLIKGMLRIKILLITLSFILILLLNIVLADNIAYVFASALIVFFKMAIVILTISHTNNLVEILLKKWYKASIIFTLLLPYYIYILNNQYINYMDLSRILFINTIGIVLYYIYNKELKNLIWAILCINAVASLFFGSRMYTLLIVISIMYLLYSQYYKKSKLFVILISIFILGLYIKIIPIVELFISITNNLGIRSRNLNLFLDYLKSSNEGLYLSGRDDIYDIVVNYLANNGFSPSGLAKVRYITEGRYYHSHNIFLEYFLVLGFILGSVLLIIYLCRIFILIYYSKYKKIIGIAIVLNLYFLAEGLTGSNFVENTIFWLAIGITYYKGDYL